MLTPTIRGMASRWRQFIVAAAFLQINSMTPAASGFEQDQRMNSMTLQGGTDTFATANRFGSAFTGTALGQENPVIGTNINTGAISLLFEMPGLTNLAGNSQTTFNIGIVNGQPIVPANNPATYSGSNDLDWWYAPNQNELDASGAPKDQLPATIASSALATSTGRLSLNPSPFGNGRLDFSAVVIKATTGSSSAPLESANGFPPGHLPGENVPPQLTSFASMTGGKLKGNISAASLAGTPIPSSLVGGSAGYTAGNSLLDVLIGGYVAFGVIQLINPTQPDTSDSAAPVAGAGAPYAFHANASKVVTSATDKNGSNVNLTAALNAAAYSAYFTFTTDRVIVHSPPPAVVTITNIGNKLVVSWPTAITNWTLQTNSDLSTTNWKNYAGATPNNTTTNSTPTGNLFFRITRP